VKWIYKFFKRGHNEGNIRKEFFDSDKWDISERDAMLKEIGLVADLEENIQIIEKTIGQSSDLVIRRFKSGTPEIPSAAIYIDGMIDRKPIEEILIALTRNVTKKEIYKDAFERVVPAVEVNEVKNMEEVFDTLLSGNTIIIFHGTNKGIACETKGWERRQVSEPNQETVIRGPREGFVESIRTNTSLLRRRIRTPHLWIESVKLGSLTRTDVAIAYIKGLTDEDILDKVKARIKKIDIDGILESGYIEEFIEDESITPFPLVLRTERIDVTASALLEGRVAILTDGTPFVLILPVDFSIMLAAPDDYYEQAPIGSFLRLIRTMAFSFSMLLPGLYVAIINFHPELLPTDLLLKITASREGVPFPVVFEALIMEGLFLTHASP
jgi:spore germination protein KA